MNDLCPECPRCASRRSYAWCTGCGGKGIVIASYMALSEPQRYREDQEMWQQAALRAVAKPEDS